MILDSLLVGAMLFSSFAIRTPNVEPNPDDYEISVGVNHPNIYVNRQWERELGNKYIDDLAWAKLEGVGVYFKPEYMNKNSRGIKYLKMDWRKTWLGMTVGFTTRSTTKYLDEYETFISVGMSKKKTYGDVEIEVTFDGYLPPDENGENTTFEFEDKFKLSWKLSDNIRLYNLGEVFKLKGQQFYKTKVGIEFKL
jgi:hypothetical protein